MKKLKLTDEKLLNLISKIESIVGLKDYDFDIHFDEYFRCDPIFKKVFITDSLEFTEKDNKFQYLRYYEYLQYITTDLNHIKIYTWILCLLHEIGHIYHAMILNDDDNIFRIDELSQTTNLVLEKDLNNVYSDPDKRYLDTYIELYADRFAFKWFPILRSTSDSEILNIFID